MVLVAVSNFRHIYSTHTCVPLNNVEISWKCSPLFFFFFTFHLVRISFLHFYFFFASSRLLRSGRLHTPVKQFLIAKVFFFVEKKISNFVSGTKKNLLFNLYFLGSTEHKKKKKLLKKRTKIHINFVEK